MRTALESAIEFRDLTPGTIIIYEETRTFDAAPWTNKRKVALFSLAGAFPCREDRAAVATG